MRIFTIALTCVASWVACAASDLTLTPDALTLVLNRALVIDGVSEWARRPINIDAVAAAMVEGVLGDPATNPMAGDTLDIPAALLRPGGEGASTWKQLDGLVEASPSGVSTVYGAEVPRGAYLLFAVQSERERVMMLEASGHGAAYVNGEPRVGDPYSFGFVRLPILLREGANQIILQHAGRGPMRVRLVESGGRPVSSDRCRMAGAVTARRSDSRTGRGGVKYTVWMSRSGLLNAHLLAAFAACSVFVAQPAAGQVAHAAEVGVPQWAKGAVWYQIFPERFRNGEPQNDPNGPGVFRVPWNSDWYSVQPGELDAMLARRGITKDAYTPHRAGSLFDVIYDRRYGGDLQGVVQKLDYLRDLGVTALYLNPIFQARSLHKYDASDYRHIDNALAGSGGSHAQEDEAYTPPASETDDPTTWTWTPADRYFIDVFLPECKKRGLRVIIDGVFNHTGTDFWAFQDIVRRGRESPYASWYQCEFDASGKLSSWIGWPGRRNGSLPEFRQVRGRAGGRDWDQTVEKGDLNAGVRKHIFDITRRWMDPNNDGDPGDGVDGWRLDVAGEIGAEFWKDWRALVKSINPDALIVAEIWSKADGLGGESGFDTQMNYPFAYPVLEWLCNKDMHANPVPASRLRERLNAVFADDAHETQLIHQNLFASHDTDRYVNMLWNPGRGYDQDCAEQNLNDSDNTRMNREGRVVVPYKPGKPPEEIYRLSVLGVAIQATYIGSPMIYYGDEIGMWGSDDPTCRKPMQWEDQFATLGNPEREDERPMTWLRDEYRKWLTLRQHPEIGPVLRLGTVRHLDSGNDDVFAFEREYQGRVMTILINRGESPYDGSLAPRSQHGVVHALAPRSAAWYMR